MFNKILGKKKKSVSDAFEIPVKTFTYDSRIVTKLGVQDVQNLAQEQDKYIHVLIKKLEAVKQEYILGIQKCDELTEKNQIINKELKRMANEHQQLQIKFTNLEASLQAIVKTSQQDFKNQHAFLQKTGLIHFEKLKTIKTLSNVFQFYRDQVELCKKIEAQNKRLKEMYGNLEMQIFQMSDKLKSNEQSIKDSVKLENCESKVSDNNDDLLDAHQELLQKLRLKKEAIDELTKLNQQQMNEINALRQKLGRQNQELTEQAQIKKNILPQICKQQKNISAFEVQTDNVEISIDKVQSKIITDKILDYQQYMRISDELQKALARIEQQKCKIEIMESQMHKLQQQIAVKSQLIIKFEGNILELKQSIQEKNNDKRKAQNKCQQKQILIQQYKNNLQTYKQLQKRYQGLQNQLETQKVQNCLKVETIRRLQEKIKDLQMNQKYTSESSYLLEQRITKYQSQITQLNSRIEIYNEDLKCKQRKHESDINQERIKSDNLKRTISVLQSKNEELNASIENVYKEILDKNLLISQMQEKLRQYKKRIEQLRKDKRRITEQFEHKIKISEEQFEKKELSGQTEQEKKSNKSESENQKMGLQNEQQRLRNSVNILADKNKVLVSQIDELKQAIGQLQKKCQEKERAIKHLNEKREHSMKQIQRLSVLSNTLQTSSFTASSNFSESASELTTPRNVSGMSREKKIADKAYRGFDILMKLNQQLYKQFILTFANQTPSQKIMGLQKAINTLVNKSSDMKDIFEDYL